MVIHIILVSLWQSPHLTVIFIAGPASGGDDSSDGESEKDGDDDDEENSDEESDQEGGEITRTLPALI